MNEECAVETEISADISAIYRHLFGIRGVAIGPVLNQGQLNLVYDIAARGKLSASLVHNADFTAFSLNGATATTTFQNSTQGIYTLRNIKCSVTAPAGLPFTLRIGSGSNVEDLMRFDSTLANPHVYITPSTILEWDGTNPNVEHTGPGDMWLPPDGVWVLQIGNGGVGDLLTQASQVYVTPYGVEPP